LTRNLELEKSGISLSVRFNSKTLSKVHHKLDLMAVVEVRWDKGGAE
jgi:hypothetical protein